MAAKKKKAKRSTLKKKRNPKKFIWAGRLGIISLPLIIIIWAGVWFFLSDADRASSNWLKSNAVSLFTDAGFRVENILVEGRKYSDPDILLALINVGKGDPIFLFNPKEAKAQIEKIGWVKSARVERRLPDTIYINLNERKPLALWQSDGGLSLIDTDGDIITKSNLEKFKDLLMVSGKGASAKAGNFIALLDTKASLKSMVNNAKLIDKRRWDLYLRDGKRIKLPENDVGLALQNIMSRHSKDNILNSDVITVIDARYKGRLIVRTKLGKVRDYKAAIEY